MRRTQSIKREQYNKRWTPIIYVAIAVVIILGTVIPFASPDSYAGTISGTGTVKFINIEGGFYGITADGGINYDPTNLDRGFQQDGLKVAFEGKVRNDLANTHQWGTMFDLTSIKKAP